MVNLNFFDYSIIRLAISMMFLSYCTGLVKLIIILKEIKYKLTKICRIHWLEIFEKSKKRSKF